MPVTEWKNPGTAANVDRNGNIAWSNPDNIKISDNNTAGVSLQQDEITDWLRATNFGFAIPVGANITGIEAKMERSASNVGVRNSAIYLRKTGTQVGDNRDPEGTWPVVEGYVNWGGSQDDWNSGLNVNDINSSDFGIDVSAYNTDANLRFANVDHIQIRVFYGIGVDNTSTATASATQISAQHICNGTDSNGILIVTVQVTDSNLSDRTISTVTHNGEPCTHITNSDSDNADDGLRTEIWYRLNPTTGGAPDIVVTAGGKCTDLTYGAISLTGVSTDISTDDYYFDGSDVVANDPDNAWNDETNTDDGVD